MKRRQIILSCLFLHTVIIVYFLDLCWLFLICKLVNSGQRALTESIFRLLLRRDTTVLSLSRIGRVIAQFYRFPKP